MPQQSFRSLLIIVILGVVASTPVGLPSAEPGTTASPQWRRLHMPRQFVDPPRQLPVFDVDPVPLIAIDELIIDLDDQDPKRRSTAHERLVQLSVRSADRVRPALEESLKFPGVDDTFRSRVQAVLKAMDDPNANPLAIAVRGLSDDSYKAALDAGPSTVTHMINMHLRGVLGVDLLYSMPPELVIPDALALLEHQRETYYRVLMAKLIEGVLSRSVLPVLESRRPDIRAAANFFVPNFFAANVRAAVAVRRLLDDEHAEMRLTAVRICALGGLRITAQHLDRLTADADEHVAAAATRLRGLLVDDPSTTKPDPQIARWIDACLAALSQDRDALARYGALRALEDMLDDHVFELADALDRASDATHPILLHVLWADASGRLHLHRRGVSVAPGKLPDDLAALRRFDLRSQGIERMPDDDLPSVGPLVRRQLMNLRGKRGQWFTWQLRSEARWSVAAKLGMGDLSDVLNREIALMDLQQKRDQETAEKLAPLAAQLAVQADGDRGERLAEPFEPWYAACVDRLEHPRLAVAVGAVRGVLTSGPAGARALRRHWRAMRERGRLDPDYIRYVRSLVVFHPYTGFLVDAGQGDRLDEELAGAWAHRGLKLDELYKSNKLYAGGPDEVVFALWGYIHNNDCSYIHPIGNYLAQHLRPYHVPLLMSWLDNSSRMAIYLTELDAREAGPAILRRVESRRTEWSSCYDHDLFHAVVRFELIEAGPVMENYYKTNRHWQYKGLRTLGGIEKERYCWTRPAAAGRASPLNAPAVLELLAARRAGLHRGFHLLNESASTALARMGYALSVDANGKATLHGIVKTWSDNGRGPGHVHLYVSGGRVGLDDYRKAIVADKTLPPPDPALHPLIDKD